MNDNFIMIVLQMLQSLQTLLNRSAKMQMELRLLHKKMDELSENGSYDDDDDEEEQALDNDTIMGFIKGLTESKVPTPRGTAPARRSPRSPHKLSGSIPESAVMNAIESLEGDNE